ncbi:hypothetical protein [Bradyrhizobium sp. Ec3.3]|uniref:hypothetical protein n=1 Tax=Bradyrhizobium sp. Ec3.3 TaxID=189753 RepID=UPI000428BD38|nr:hypothetical protein [Bradyrhizobium sp. Ec3.3]
MLNKEDRAMVREAAKGLNGAAAANFESAVIARLQEALDAGVIDCVAKNHIRAACTAELSKGK